MNGLLVVDVGNSTTRVGVWQDGEAREVAVLGTREIADSPDSQLRLDAIAESAGVERLRVGISAVVPQVETAWVRWCQERGVPFLAIHGDTPAPLVNRYAEPAQLGPDRLASAVGAVRRLGAPVIVASLGTATVLDAVSANREFLGGAIAAGIETGLVALSEKTAALHRIVLTGAAHAIGHNTEQCLRSGAVLGAAAMIEGLVARLRGTVGEAAPVALTGGHAAMVSEYLMVEHRLLPNLTLDGIGAIWEHNGGGA